MPRRAEDFADYQDDFYDDWYQAKSRNKKLSASIKYPTGSTYSNIYERDRLRTNNDATIMQHTPVPLAKVKKVLDDCNLLLEPLKYSIASSNLSLVRNASSAVAFSMNKKNRWALPALVEKKIEELRPVFANKDFNVTAVMVANSDRIISRAHRANYFSVTSTDPKIPNQRYPSAKHRRRPVKLNAATIDTILQRDQHLLFRRRPLGGARRSKRVVNLRKYFADKRRVFRYGNRDRNSGIKRQNETFLVTDANEPVRDPDERPTYTFNFSFYKPDRILKTKKCNPSRDRLGYGSKLARREHVYRVRTRARQVKTYEKHARKRKEAEELRDSIADAMITNEYWKTDEDRRIKSLFTISESEIVANEIKVDLDEMVRSGRTSAPIPQVDCLTPPKSRSNSSISIAESKTHVIFVDADDPAFAKFARSLKTKPATTPAKTVVEVPVAMPAPLARIDFQVADMNSFCASMSPEKLKAKIELKSAFQINNEANPSKLIILLDALLSSRFVDNDVLSQLLISGGLTSFMILNNAMNAQEVASFTLNSRLSKYTGADGSNVENVVKAELLSYETKFATIDELVDFVVNCLAKFIEHNISLDNTSLPASKAEKQHNHLTSKLGRLVCIDKQVFNDAYLRLMVKSLEKDQEGISEKGIDGSFMSTDMCPICYGDLDGQENFLVGLNECGHAACVQCWLSFIHTSIHSLKTTTANAEGTNSETGNENGINFRRLTCLHYKCQTSLSLGFLSTLVSPELIEKYVQFNKDIYLMSNKDVVYCRNEKCNRLLLVNEKLEEFKCASAEDESEMARKNVVLECDCGYLMCKLCLKEAHFPALCSQASVYEKELKEQEKFRKKAVEDDGTLYESEGKNCPSCGNYMEKNGGCNHMSCICGNHYCWNCLKPFSYSSHTCAKPVEVVKYDAWNFLSSKRKNAFYRHNYDQLMTAQREKRLKINELYLKKKNVFKVYLSAFKELSSPASEVSALVKQAIAETSSGEDALQEINPNFVIGQRLKVLSQFIYHEFDKTIENLRKHYYLNEYIALLFNCRRSENKYFVINKFSFKANVLQSLKKSISLAERLEVIHQNATNYQDLIRMVKLNNESCQFTQNLKHFILNSLDLYSKSKLIC